MEIGTSLLPNAAAAGFYLFVAIYHIPIHFRRRSALHLYVGLAALGALGVDMAGMALVTGLVTRGMIGTSILCIALTSFLLSAFGISLSDGRMPLSVKLLGIAAIASGAAVFRWDAAQVPALLCSAGLLVFGAVRVLIDRSRRLPETGKAAVGFVVLVLALLWDVGRDFGLPASDLVPIGGFAVLFTSLGWALSDRFERIHRELDDLRRELEDRVVERTHTIEAANRRLRRYFPSQVVARILGSDEDESPKTERRLVTILFADLVGFTAFADGTDPERVCGVLNEHFAAMIEEIESHGGTLDKVMGDGLMAMFGAPIPQSPEEQARSSVDAAFAMQRRFSALRREWTARKLAPPEGMRIGIHQDDVAVGSIGTGELRSYTAIGSGVNFAARLEASAPVGGVLVSSEVRKRLGAESPFAVVPGLRIKGLAESVDAWEWRPEAGA